MAVGQITNQLVLLCHDSHRSPNNSCAKLSYRANEGERYRLQGGRHRTVTRPSAIGGSTQSEQPREETYRDAAARGKSEPPVCARQTSEAPLSKSKSRHSMARALGRSLAAARTLASAGHVHTNRAATLLALCGRA
ncbi:unnamed protein product [Pieris macdunnoughi]|uniref:Uncharacterized protein n=1 Tax=Pieris macdunnoughi TaxID=345717 RepID=A0A821XTJ9_9NEOP|nr:unnamed protein product [Pieris macdunnoughi]